MDIPETVSLLNQERSNNRMYVSLVEARATYFTDDKTLPSLPASMLNVLQADRTASGRWPGSPETRAGAALGAVRRDGERQLFAADHSKVNR